MAPVTYYSTQFCVAFVEIDVGGALERRAAMIRRSVPQIFGGFDARSSPARAGKLDPLLAG